MNQDLSNKQKEILAFIVQHVQLKGFPPSVREICDGVNLKSTSSVHAQLSRLEEKGYIRRDPSKTRSIEICDDEFALDRREIVNIPIVGSVAAGQPLLAEERIEGYFPMTPELLGNHQYFMLKVKGESMINAGIFDGDMVLIEETQDVHNGEIVVALIEDSATVKTFYREASRIRLQPENDSMEPIYATDLRILGRVTGLYRSI